MTSSKTSSRKSGKPKTKRSSASGPTKSSNTSTKNSKPEPAPEPVEAEPTTIAPAANATQRIDDAIEQTRAWILTGETAAKVVEAITANYPELDAGQIFKSTVEGIAGASNVDPRYLRGFVLDGYRDIFRRALEIADLTTALKSLKLIDDFAKR